MTNIVNMDNTMKPFKFGSPECAKHLAEMLMINKSGWVDEEIGCKAPQVTIYSTFPDLNAILKEDNKRQNYVYYLL